MALVVIAVELPGDAGTANRLWEVPDHVAEQVAELLGQPHMESVTSGTELVALGELAEQAEHPVLYRDVA